jgi:hypothetical protein
VVAAVYGVGLEVSIGPVFGEVGPASRLEGPGSLTDPAPPHSVFRSEVAV